MIRVNLQPKIALEIKEGFKLPIWLPILLFLALVVVAAGTYLDMSSKIKSAEALIKIYDFKLRDFQKILDEYEQTLAEKDYLQGKRDFVNGISQNQMQWVGFFDEMRSKMPKDVWLTSFEGQRSGDYDVEGRTFSFSSIGFFMLQFNSIPNISTVNLLSATADVGGSTGGKEDRSIETLAKAFKISGAMKLDTAADKKKEAKKTVKKAGR